MVGRLECTVRQDHGHSMPRRRQGERSFWVAERPCDGALFPADRPLPGGGGGACSAIDAQNILVSSRFYRPPVLCQELLLAHELAHLQQLARTGCDPVRALEDEAWE